MPVGKPAPSQVSEGRRRQWGKGAVLLGKGACHKITALLSLAGQPPSSTTKRENRPRGGEGLARSWTRTEAGSLKGSGPASCCTASSPPPPPQGSGAGRREGRVDANGLFCSVSCNRAPAGLPDTCGSAHSSGRDQAGLPDSHSCAKPAGPRALFSAREAPLRAAGGGVGWEGLFLELLSCWGS